MGFATLIILVQSAYPLKEFHEVYRDNIKLELDPKPAELNCCQNMIHGLTNHLSGQDHWSAAKEYYRHALTCGRFPASQFLSWIESGKRVSFDQTCSNFRGHQQLTEAIERHKSLKVELNASDFRGLVLASSLAAMKEPAPTDHMWHSLRMLHDISEAGGTYAEVKKSVGRIGPIHNVQDSNGLPVAGLLRERLSSEEEGWLDLDILEFCSGAFSVIGTPSGPLVPLLTQSDLDVAAQLAFLEGAQPVAPSFSLDNAPSKRTDMRLDRKTFDPAWMAATPFGQSMYLADWLMKSFTMRNGLPSVTDPLVSGATVEGWKPPAVVEAVSKATGHRTMPDGSSAPNGRLEIVVRSADVSRASFRKNLFWKTEQYRLNKIDLFIESSLYSGSGDSRDEEHHFRNDPSTDPGAAAKVISDNYQYIGNLFPVFERVGLILAVFSMMCQARRDGVELSGATKRRIDRRIKNYKSDFEKNYPKYELSPKPFHKGGCYCNGGVSGRAQATVTSSQAKPFTSRPPAINWLVTPEGVSSPVPHGAVKMPTDKGQGLRFGGGSGGKWGEKEYGKGEFNNRTSEVWVMPATENHPARTYFKNSRNQKVDPFTGKTIDQDNPLAHIYHKSDKNE